MTTAALAPQLPLSSTSAIEMLLSQSLQPDKNVETSMHEFSSVASSHACPSSPTDGGGSLATNLEVLLSRYAQLEVSGGNSSPSCESSPSTAERIYSHHTSSPSVASLDNIEETSDDQP